MLDFYTGEVVDELGTDSDSINLLREEVNASEDFSSYFFPASFGVDNNIDQSAVELLQKLRENHVITGKIPFR